MYRSALAERKVLVLIDGASNAAQVRPLLPSTASSAVIVTSRSRLADIDGAKIIELGGMLPADAVTLLGKISGRQLAGANTGSANTRPTNTSDRPTRGRIATWHSAEARGRLMRGRLCPSRPRAGISRWPCGSRAPGSPTTRPADGTPRRLLANENRRLDELSLGDQSVRARLAKATQAAERPGQDRARAARRRRTPGRSRLADRLAARGAGRQPGRPGARERRVTASRPWRTERPTATGEPLYRMHPLVRAYAGELLARRQPRHRRRGHRQAARLRLARAGQRRRERHARPPPAHPNQPELASVQRQR